MQQGQSAVCRYMTCALVAGALVACGGDELVTTESDAPTTPVIVVSVNPHAPGRAPTGITRPGGNANVVVYAQDPTAVFPGIDGVAATVNGETLLPTSDGRFLTAAIELPPGAPFEVLVTYKEVTYRAAGTQYETFPELGTPGEDAVWDLNAPLLVTWNGTPRNPGSLQYVTFTNLRASSGVATTTNTLPATALSAEVRAGTLPAGLYRLTLLQHEAWPVEGADVRSRLNLVASAHRDILVTDGEEF